MERTEDSLPATAVDKVGGRTFILRERLTDLDRGTAAMFNQLTTDHDHHIIFKNRHKGGRGHVLHLDAPTVALLNDWRQIQDDEKAMFGPAYHGHDYVFCLEDGRSYHPERFSREFLRKQHQYNHANRNFVARVVDLNTIIIDSADFYGVNGSHLVATPDAVTINDSITLAGNTMMGTNGIVVGPMGFAM